MFSYLLSFTNSVWLPCSQMKFPLASLTLLNTNYQASSSFSPLLLLSFFIFHLFLFFTHVHARVTSLSSLLSSLRNFSFSSSPLFSSWQNKDSRLMFYQQVSLKYTSFLLPLDIDYLFKRQKYAFSAMNSPQSFLYCV